MQMSYLVNAWKYQENLPTKNWYVRGIKGPCCMLHAILQGCTNVEGVKRNKIIINEYLKLHLRLLFVMLEMSKALYTYINRMKPLQQYVHTVASSLSNSK